MGCDIHAFIEDRRECVAELFLNRDYDLFSLFAGVRNQESKIMPVFPARGFPISEISWRAKNRYLERESDFHSASYFNYDDICKVLSRCKFDDDFDKNTINTVEWIVKTMTNLEKPRLIFWFDN